MKSGNSEIQFKRERKLRRERKRDLEREREGRERDKGKRGKRMAGGLAGQGQRGRRAPAVAGLG